MCLDVCRYDGSVVKISAEACAARVTRVDPRVCKPFVLAMPFASWVLEPRLKTHVPKTQSLHSYILKNGFLKLFAIFQMKDYEVLEIT